MARSTAALLAFAAIAGVAIAADDSNIGSRHAVDLKKVRTTKTVEKKCANYFSEYISPEGDHIKREMRCCGLNILIRNQRGASAIMTCVNFPAVSPGNCGNLSRESLVDAKLRQNSASIQFVNLHLMRCIKMSRAAM